MTITAIVRDEEGRRFRNETVSWGVNPSLIVSADQTTDDVGEARLVIHAPTVASTEAVSVTVSNFSSKCYAEFAEPGAPSIHIIQPGSLDTVSGYVEIVLEAWDNEGTSPGISRISLLIDGQEISSSPGNPVETGWASYQVSNGSHQITARAIDRDGQIGYSNVVTVNCQNGISKVSISPRTVGINTPIHLSAELAVAGNWDVSINDMEGNPKWSTSGFGTIVSVDWPGTADGNMYTISMSTTTGASVSETVVVNPVDYPQVLLVSEEKGFRRYDQLLNDLKKVAERKGLTWNIFLPDDAKWEVIKPRLASSMCRYFFIYCHGHYDASYLPEPVTRLYITASNHVLYARRWAGAPQENDPDPGYAGYKVAYAEGIRSEPLRLAWIGACLNGRIGADRSSNENDYYFGKYGVKSCYEMKPAPAWNDMAFALGITPPAAIERACAYVGYYEVGPVLESYVGGGSVAGMIVLAWNLMADGRTFEETRQWIEDNDEGRRYYRIPAKDLPNPKYPGHYTVAPFYNWRFWGNAGAELF